MDRRQLLASAKDFADRALKAHTEDDAKFVLFSAAISLEHLCKAYLCDMNPALLMEIRNGQFDSLLHLTGYGIKARKLDSPRTISAREALARIERLLPGLAISKERLAQLIDVRDGVVHLGYLTEKDTREILAAYLRLSNGIYDELDVAKSDRWGRYEELVESLISESISEIERDVRRRMVAAKLRNDALLRAIPSAQHEAVMRARQSEVARILTRSDEQAVDVACPVCENKGASYLGEIESRYEICADLTVLHHECFIMILHPRSFVCGACELKLDGQDEIVFSGLPASWQIGKCMNPHEYYEPRTSSKVLRKTSKSRKPST